MANSTNRPVFGHLITAAVTPFGRSGKVNYDSVLKIMEHLEGTGTDSVVVAGTTGESPTLSHSEKLELFRFWRKNARKKTLIIAATGGNSTQDSVTLTGEADEVGVDGIMLVGPYYNRPQPSGQYKHFSTVAKATRLPIILYNIPGRTGLNIDTDVICELSKIPNIVGIKDATGDLDKASAVQRKTRPGFSVYSGDDSLTLPILSVGGVGVVGVASHLVGREMKRMITSYLAGDPKRALKIHLELFDLFRALFVVTNPIPIKAALNMVGFDVGSCRLPLNGLDKDKAKRLNSVLKRYNLI